MAELSVDPNANTRCRSTGDPRLDRALYQWLTWDKVSGRGRAGGSAPGSAGAARGRSRPINQTSRHDPTFSRTRRTLTETRSRLDSGRMLTEKRDGPVGSVVIGSALSWCESDWSHRNLAELAVVRAVER